MKIKFFNGTEKEFKSLIGANLGYADLRRVTMSTEDLKRVVTGRTILASGKLKVFKKLRGGVICELEIPEEARRLGGVIGRKCRAEYALVLSGEGFSQHDETFFYEAGKTVKPESFDSNPLVECSGGIHFFITREEAENY